MYFNFLFLFLVIGIIFIIFNFIDFKEFYSNAKNTMSENNREPDTCGDCAGLCLSGNEGKFGPKNCKNYYAHANYARGYLSNLTNADDWTSNINTNDIQSPSETACSQFVKNLTQSLYLYILSSTYSKSLSFDTFGNDSEVYIDPNVPNTKNYCSTTVSSESLPQKWQINIVGSTNPNTCLVTICSYSNSKPKYYLVAKKNGTVKVSLFGGSNDQIWQIYPVTNSTFRIKSYKYCTYLTSENYGYLKSNAGIVYLSNLSKSSQTIWTYMSCGTKPQSQIQDSKSEEYKPMRSVSDFPYLNDRTGPEQSIMPAGVSLSPDAQKNWTGRSVWMPQFTKVWNGTYSGAQSDVQFALNELGQCLEGGKCFNDTNGLCKMVYQITKEPYEKEITMTVNLYNTKNYISATGTVDVTAELDCANLPSGECTLPSLSVGVPEGGCAVQLEEVAMNYFMEGPNPTFNSEFQKKNFKKVKFPTFYVESAGADILTGKNSKGNTIFLEMQPMSGFNIKVDVTIIWSSNIYKFTVDKSNNYLSSISNNLSKIFNIF